MENLIINLFTILLLASNIEQVAALEQSQVLEERLGAVVEKSYNLDMLILAVITGSEPNRGVDCRAGHSLAVEAANRRRDILPDYHINALIEDQMKVASNSPRMVLNFYNEFKDQKMVEMSKFPSPVIIGPSNSNGCKAIGNFLHLIDYINVATTCTASFLIDKERFPNVFTTIPTSNPHNYGYIHFIKDIGRWNKVAVITFAAHINTYYAALHFQQVASDVGIDVPWFNGVMQFDRETALSLKASEARILVLMVASIPEVVNFFCKMHDVGVSGPKYIFFIYDTGFPDPTKLSEFPFKGCSRSVVADQIKRSFWMGNLDDHDDPLMASSFGYNRVEFDQLFDEYKGFQRDMDYEWRFNCHDATMQGILVLDQAERNLNLRNLSLRHFTEHSKEVSQVIYEAAVNVDYYGLRAPRVRYDRNKELFGLPNFITYWTPEAGHTKVVAVRKMENTSTYDYDGYWVESLVEPFPWTTVDGEPPKDSAVKVENTLKPSSTFFGFILMFCVGSILLKPVVARKVFKEKQRKHFHQFRICTLTLVGCTFLDISAVFLSIPIPTVFPTWILFLFTFLIGIGLLFSTLAIHTIIFKKYQKQRKLVRFTERTLQMFIDLLELKTIQSQAIHFLLYFVIVVIFPLVSNPKCEKTTIAKEIPNENEDTLMTIYFNICKFDNFNSYIIIVVIYNAGLLIAAIGLSISMMIRRVQKEVGQIKMVFLRIGYATTAIIICGFALTTNMNPMAKIYISSIVCILVSTLTSLSFLSSSKLKLPGQTLATMRWRSGFKVTTWKQHSNNNIITNPGDNKIKSTPHRTSLTLHGSVGHLKKINR